MNLMSIYLSRHTNSVTHAEWIPYLVKVTNLMCYLNSAIDPVIYYCLSGEHS